MKKKAEDLVIDFFKDRYGLMMARTLFAQYLAKNGITDFDALDMQDKIQFGQSIIESVYSKFYGDEQIQNLKILFLMRFSINAAAEKVETMINIPAELDLLPLKGVSTADLNDVFQKFEDETMTNFGFECTNMIEGLLMLTFENTKAVDLSAKLIEVMLSSTAEGTVLDEMKISAIYEFFNIVLPDFMKVIGDTYGKEIFYTPLYYDQFKINPKYFTKDGKFNAPERMFESGITIKVGDIEIEGKIIFFMTGADQTFIDLLNKSGGRVQDPFDVTPPVMVVEKSGDKRADMEALFEKLGIKLDNIEYLLTEVGQPDFSFFQFRDFMKFTSILVDKYFARASDAKKKSIKMNVRNILGMG